MHRHAEKYTRCQFCLAVSFGSYLHIKQYEIYFVLLTIFRNDCYVYICIISGKHGTCAHEESKFKNKRQVISLSDLVEICCDMGISVAVLG